MANISIGISAHDNASPELNKVGTAAQGMAEKLKSAASSTDGDASKINSALREVSRAGRTAAADNTSSSRRIEENTRSVGSRFSDMGSKISAVAGGLGLYGLAQKVGDFAKESVDKMGALAISTKNLQQVIGGTDEEVSALTATGSRFGLSTENMSVSLTHLAKSASTAENGIQTYQQKQEAAAAKGKTYVGGLNATSQAFEDLGVKVTDSSGHLRSVTDMMPELADAFQKVENPTERATLAQQLFGRAGKNMLPLLMQGSEGIKKYTDAAKESGAVVNGSMVNSAVKYKMANAELDESVEGLQVKIGASLYPELTRLVGVLSSKVIPTMSAVMQWMSRNSATVSVFAKGLATLAIVFGALSVITKIVNAFRTMAATLKLVAGAQKMATTAQTLLDVAMNANPIGLVVVAIAALVTALVLFFTKTKVGQQIWSNFVSWLKTTFNGVAKWWSSLWKNIGDFFKTAGTDISNIGKDLLNGLVSLFLNWTLPGLIISHGNQILDFIKSIPGKIKDFFSGAGTWLVNIGKNLLDGLVNGIKSKISSVMSTIGNIASSIEHTFTSFFGIHSPSTRAFTWAVYIAQGLINGFQSKAGAVGSAMTGMFRDSVQELTSDQISSLQDDADSKNADAADAQGKIATYRADEKKAKTTLSTSLKKAKSTESASLKKAKSARSKSLKAAKATYKKAMSKAKTSKQKKAAKSAYDKRTSAANTAYEKRQDAARASYEKHAQTAEAHYKKSEAHDAAQVSHWAQVTAQDKATAASDLAQIAASNSIRPTALTASSFTGFMQPIRTGSLRSGMSTSSLGGSVDGRTVNTTLNITMPTSDPAKVAIAAQWGVGKGLAL